MPKKIKPIKAKAWKAFSLFIRKSHADKQGYVHCYTCDKKMHWKESQAGHCFSGRQNSILFEEQVVRPQCMGCNVFHHGQLHIFTHKLREELGAELYEFLYKQQFQVVRYKYHDFLAIKVDYEFKCNLL